jgi:hypothetical protein
MPCYSFDVKNGHRLVDPAGLECRDDVERFVQGPHVARRIAIEGLRYLTERLR